MKNFAPKLNWASRYFYLTILGQIFAYDKFSIIMSFIYEIQQQKIDIFSFHLQNRLTAGRA